SARSIEMISPTEERQLRSALLDCMASEPRLARRLIFRGAGAIRHFYGGRRYSRDQDFLIVRQGEQEDAIAEPEFSKALMDQALTRGLPMLFPDYAQRWQWIQQELHIELAPGVEPIECRSLET